MKLAKDHTKLKEDVAALRFINKQTGYNLDIGDIIRKKYCFERFVSSEKLGEEMVVVGGTIGIIGLPMIAGLAFGFAIGAEYFGKWIPPKWCGLVGSVAGITLGCMINYVTPIEQASRAYSTVRKAKEYKSVYDLEGVEGLIKKDLRFDKF